MVTKYKEIEVSRLNDILSFLSTSNELDLEAFDILIYGGGGQSRKFYRDLRMDKELEILWTGWCGPRWTYVLSFIPGQAGLIKLLKQNRLKALFEDLSVWSVSDLYYIPKALTPIVTSEIERAPHSHNPIEILENQKQFLFMQAEMDEAIIRNSKEYYFFDYRIGVSTLPEIQDLFAAL